MGMIFIFKIIFDKKFINLLLLGYSNNINLIFKQNANSLNKILICPKHTLQWTLDANYIEGDNFANIRNVFR